MRTTSSPEYSRNYGFWNEAEQEALLRSSVAIAGVGGDGYQLGLRLAMMGVQRLRIADPERFEPENANRVFGARTSTYGRSKAEVFREQVLDINPHAEIELFEEGVTPDNVEHFVAGVDLVFDESELRYLHIGTGIARASRAGGVPVVLVMNIGFSAQVTSFDPGSRHTFERFMGIPAHMPLDEIKDLSVDFARCVPFLPTYTDLRTLGAVEEGAPLPSIAQGVDVASAIGATQGFLHLTAGVSNRRPSPIWAPRVASLDGYALRGRTTRFARMSHYRHVLLGAARQKLGLNPLASFTSADLDRRASIG